MERVGIVTLFGLYNYGNRLQNYATQEVFKSLGYECRTIVSSEYEFKYGFWIKTILRKEWRHISFCRFNRKYIPLYKIPHSPVLFPAKIAADFMFFVVGSDQVWNPEIRQNQRENFFLEFADKEQRLTISPSMAVDEIPEQWRERFKQGLTGFEYISVREERSKAIIEKLIKKKVEVLIDPTMAVTKEKWEKVEKKVRGLPCKYVVKMFLGRVNDAYNKKIDEWALEKKCEIVDFSKKPWINMGPDAFLTIIHHAILVFTDSFHCAVFSILYETPFYVSFREGNGINDATTRMSSRITTLVDKFGFSDRIMGDEKEILADNLDFSKSRVQLEIEREKFWSFMTMQISHLGKR